MKVLGVSCHYHDASAALVIDGAVIASSAEERFSRQKHDPAFPVQAIRFCLEQAGLSASELDLVAFHEDPATKLSRSLSTSFSLFPCSLRTFLKSAREAIGGGLWVRNELGRQLGVAPEKIVCTPHHMSHAAHAFLTSPYREAAVMTIDAVGEWTSSAIFRASRVDGNTRIEPLDVSPFPHSLGLAYSAFTAFLGFKVNDGECSTMALAAFGQPRFVAQMREIIVVAADGRHALARDWFDFTDEDSIPVTAKFTSVFGEPRTFKNKIGLDCLAAAQTGISLDDQRFADIACSLQVVIEEAVLAYAKLARELTGLENLCYAGGVALNCVANGRLVRENIFGGVYIPPDPGDGGGAMGAALYASSLRSGGSAMPSRPASTVQLRKDFLPFHGQEISEAELAELAPHLKPEKWQRFSLLRPSALGEKSLTTTRFSSQSEMITWTAGKIQAGKMVGWCQGRFEDGPRALGHRSILIRSDDLELARRLSKRVKLRASFRPYAASMTERQALISLDGFACGQSTAHWMQSSYVIRESSRQSLRAASHVDGTTRVQSVTREGNEIFHALLTELGRLGGPEAVLNTSLNEAGQPLVATTADALLMFARTELDVLVVGNSAIEKNAGSEK